MINRLLKLVQRPERGWDPIRTEYAERYAAREFAALDQGLVNEVEAWSGPLVGKTVLDLGGGPGQYAIEFARRGARVFWHDVSRSYLEIFRREAGRSNVSVTATLGYMEEARGEYDVLFNRVCWYYCVSDAAFARKVVSLVRPGGSGFLIINTERYLEEAWRALSPVQRLKSRGLFRLNSWTSIKIGHVMPTHSCIERLFRRLDLRELIVGHREEMTLVRFRR